MRETRANPPDLTLPELLVRRARGASDGRLALDAAGGLIAGALVLVLHPPAWTVILSAAVCFVAFGLWGISDRALRENGVAPHGAPVLRALRAAAVALGVLGGVSLAATAMALILGTWIS